jgi:hypothetical protein
MAWKLKFHFLAVNIWNVEKIKRKSGLFLFWVFFECLVASSKKLGGS